MLRVSVFCFVASYAVALGCELIRLRSGAAWIRWTATLFSSAGFLAQTLYLVARSQQSQLPPLLSSTHDWLLVLAWVLMLVHHSVLVLDRRLCSGLIFLPLVLLLAGAAQLTGTTQSTLLDANRGWKMLHSSLLVLGMTAVALALVSGLLFLWQHRRLKTRSALQQGSTLPSLARLEWFNRWCVIVSVPLLSLGVASGFILSRMRLGGDRSVTWADPVVLGGTVCWLVMSGVLAWILAWRGQSARHVAWLTVFASGFLLFSLIGLQVLASFAGQASVHGSAVAPNQAPLPTGNSPSPVTPPPALAPVTN